MAPYDVGGHYTSFSTAGGARPGPWRPPPGDDVRAAARAAAKVFAAREAAFRNGARPGTSGGRGPDHVQAWQLSYLL